MMSILLKQLFTWLIEPGQLLAAVLVAVMVFSALGVAYSAHLTRNSYRDVLRLEKDFDDLEHEYEKLLLEQSAWADYTRLDQLAHDRLAMMAPAPEDTVVIQ